MPAVHHQLQEESKEAASYTALVHYLRVGKKLICFYRYRTKLLQADLLEKCLTLEKPLASLLHLPC